MTAKRQQDLRAIFGTEISKGLYALVWLQIFACVFLLKMPGDWVSRVLWSKTPAEQDLQGSLTSALSSFAASDVAIVTSIDFDK